MAGKKSNPLATRPKNVCILGLGASIYDYVAHMTASHGDLHFDEIWALNMGASIFRHDKLWVMDDLRRQNKNFPAYGRVLAQHDRPIITSTPYAEFPTSVRFPIEEVVDAIGDDLFRNTVCYAIGYALITGVKELTLYGCDFHYPQTDLREEGGQNAAYLLGLGRHFGMTFRLPQNTSLLNASSSIVGADGRPRRILYGYVKQPFIEEKEIENEGNRPRVKWGTQVREGEGDSTDKNDGNQSVSTSGQQGQSASLHPEGKSVRRGWRADSGSASMVPRGDQKGESTNSERSGLVAAISPDGNEAKQTDKISNTTIDSDHP